jgi:pimeloyl-ACP methyl ester carboxylesterase
MKKIPMLMVVLAVSFSLCISDLRGNTPRREEFIHEPVFNSTIYFYESGRQHAESVVLLHGTGDEGARVWKNLIPELEKKYHVLAFDLPGFARSSKETQMYSPKNYAAFIDWIVTKHTKGPVYIIGHSLGGAISLYYAGTQSEGLERLIVIDTAGILNRSAFLKNFINVKPNRFLDLINTPVSVIQNYIIAHLESMDKDLTPENNDQSLTSQFLRKKLYGGDSGKIAAMALLNTDFSGILENIHVPTLIVWGEKDPVVPLRVGRILEWMVPGSDLRIMPDVGHSPMIDRPDEFNRIVMEWLTAPPRRKERVTPSFTSDTVLLCEDKDCVITNGSYDRIEIKNSNNTQIVNVAAKHISVEKSIVSIEGSSIMSNDVAVKVIDSVANISGCSIDANIAVLTSNSSVDLAGVKLTGKTAAVREAALKSGAKSTVIFSVSKIKSPFNDGYKHEIKVVTDNNPY